MQFGKSKIGYTAVSCIVYTTMIRTSKSSVHNKSQIQDAGEILILIFSCN